MARAFPHRARFRPSAKKLNKGFTLIELLVAMIVGGIIVVILLSLVVNLLETNQREASRSDTQRETQMALDYIARDLREAVYVYDGNCLVEDLRPTFPNAQGQQEPLTCRGLLSSLPDNVAGRGTNAGTKPVLAFWKVDDLPQNVQDLCRANAAEYSKPLAQQSGVLKGIPCASGQMYTLVVYTLDESNPSGTWQGRARIKRYKLPQFTGGTPIQVSQGWVYPISETTSFATWPAAPESYIVDPKFGTGPVAPPNETINGTYQVLMDFVDTDGLVDSNGTPITEETRLCPQPTAAAVPNVTPLEVDGYQITPKSSIANGKRGFYVCVNGSGSNGRKNQEVVVTIQGNAAGKPGFPSNSRNASFPMQTRVLTRGVVNKSV
jgi:prepilin-type N-terminal cleavage/methylation domain-containing protein